MSEYWKSTPKYYCKHCDVYVRDTKLERTNHEATVKHQNALKRFLRNLHRTHDQEQREKERAKREVDRLNGVVSAPVPNASSSSSSKPAASDQRQQQWEQLADMGVEIPSELRRDMAMAGNWTVTETRIIDDDDDQEEKIEAKATGVRKRVKEEHEEEEEEAIQGLFKKRPKWGRNTRQGGAGGDDDDADLDALLSGNLVVKKAKEEENVTTSNDAPGLVKKEEGADEGEGEASSRMAKKEQPRSQSPPVKTEEDETQQINMVSPKVKTEEGGDEASDEKKSTEPAATVAPTVVFKKRKHKDAKQKAASKT